MKEKGSIPRLAVLSAAFILFITSCTKNDDKPENTWLESSEYVSLYTTASVNNMIDLASTQSPGISTLKQYVRSGVEVYKISYRTKAGDEDIIASGLVCVPVAGGDYPVISFQNGTNTLNSQAPSINPMNSSYVLVETLASMGFIVVIPDYPGFGTSSNVAHPYLVASPTVISVTDMFRAVQELDETELDEISIRNEYYLLGYSQGGWATLSLHKAMELEYQDDFNLAGSACGAGPYDINLLFSNMINVTNYPMPVYLGYIYNAYSSYKQFSNPVTDIFSEPYASSIASLYDGSKSFDQINSQLSTSIASLLNPDFVSGYASSDRYLPVRNAFKANSIQPWHTYKPLMLIHGGGDTQVNPVTTETMYTAMLQAGTSSTDCTKMILPGLDHSDGIIPAMLEGIKFIINLKESR